MYARYEALDLGRIPFHASAGAWGPRMPIQAPSLPAIHDEVTLTSAAQFETARGSHRRIVLAAGVTLPQAVLHGFQDVEIVIRNGAAIRKLNLGNNQRLFIHGEVIGRRNPARLDEIEAGYPGPVTDLVIDGLDSVPQSYCSCLLTGSTHPLQRVSITNMRVYGGLGLWDGGASDVVIAGCNMWNHSGWWIWRIDGKATYDRIAMFRNYLVSKGQPVLRLHRPTTVWIGENTWVNSTQFAPDSTGFVLRMLDSHGSRVWFEHGRVHSQGSLGTEFHPAHPGHVAYFRVDPDTTIVTDGGWTGGVPPGQGDDWVVKPRVLPTAGNPIPPWSDRNASGDPRELAP